MLTPIATGAMKTSRLSAKSSIDVVQTALDPRIKRG
jgi:hypothetical protein